MHLAPRDLDKLILHQAGFLAQKRLARGVRLNYPEAVALIATVVLEMIRDGSRGVADLMDVGRQLLGRRQVMTGVPEMIYDVQVEGTFPDGTKLVTVHHPVVREDGDLNLALYGSFLPVPKLEAFGAAEVEAAAPGAYEIEAGSVELNAGRNAIGISVTNLGDRPIQVGSHYPFIETNASLRFDRSASYGMRLDIAAGTAVRFEPGDTRMVQLVEIAGEKIVRGGNGLCDGEVTEANRVGVMKRVVAGGFADEPTKAGPA